MSNHGWIGVDLDGTLAEYDGWQGAFIIGDPVPAMMERVLNWCNAGKDVRIFTARVCDSEDDPDHSILVRAAINNWCVQHLGRVLPITNRKDFGMSELWDDRAVQIIPNTGQRADGQP